MKNLENIKFKPLLDSLRLQKISDEEYFSSHYSDYISNSRLAKINPDQDGTLQKFIDGLQANRLFIPSLPLGSAVHMITLQPDYFQLIPEITTKPSAKVGFIADELLNIAKDTFNPTKEEIYKACAIVDYYKGNPSDAQYNKLLNQLQVYFKDLKHFYDTDERSKNNKECIFLEPKQMETAKACIKALEENSKIQDKLHPKGLINTPISENEQAILLDVEVSLPNLEPIIIKLKSKLDNYTIDAESNTITVNDIKTHGKMLNEFEPALNHFHYFREMSMYCYLLKLCANKFYGLSNPKIESNFLVVSTIPNYYTKVVPMTPKLFNKGFKEFKYLLKLAAVTLYFKDENKALKYLNDCK